MEAQLVSVVEALGDPALPIHGLTRERVVRLVQTKAVVGARVAGRWLVSTESLREWATRSQRETQR